LMIFSEKWKPSFEHFEALPAISITTG
jgi:hypothetical protein